MAGSAASNALDDMPSAGSVDAILSRTRESLLFSAEGVGEIEALEKLLRIQAGRAAAARSVYHNSISLTPSKG